MNLDCPSCGAQRVVRNVKKADWYRPGVYFWPGFGFAVAAFGLWELWRIEGGFVRLAGAGIALICWAAFLYWSFRAREGFRVDACSECGADDGLRVRPWSR